jgi:uncharacterized protein YgbK (DUF1537 family)
MKPLLTYYGDDFTGSTDALEQLTLAGLRTVLFIRPPTVKQLARFGKLQAVGVAGRTRSLGKRELARELRPALKQLQALGSRHLHYKVCSTFDSSPTIGNIGRVLELGADLFQSPFVPIVAAAPNLGRFTVFGNHFAGYSIGGAGSVYRLDRHPSISRHPGTPMTEADLRVHLSRQTKKRVALFDVLKLGLPETEARAAFADVLKERPDAVLFDVLFPEHLARIGRLLDSFASPKRPLFSIGSSAIETALANHWARNADRSMKPIPFAGAAAQVLIGSGSCSPITMAQIAYARRQGFVEVPLNVKALRLQRTADPELERATKLVSKHLRAGHSVLVHTTHSVTSGQNGLEHLGTILGRVVRAAAAECSVRRICFAGGDTSSYAARALGIEALEMKSRLTPGAPLCRAWAPGSPVDGCEMVFKGGQVGDENYFERVRTGIH